MPNPVEEFQDWLEGRGATRIHFTPRGDADTSGLLDFELDFPGDQPIRSGVRFQDGRVEEATLRFGVLDADLFPTHPTEDRDQLQRLHNIAKRSGANSLGAVVVNYGDTTYDPRPHILIGWVPTVAEDEEILTVEEYDRDYSVQTIKDIIDRYGRNLRREFAAEYVEDPNI